MSNHDIKAKNPGRADNLGQVGQGSQDAVRHKKDALHHKSHSTSQPDSADMQPGEGQPEIPKVGSRDAPGG
jgi:hypothetical protein